MNFRKYNLGDIQAVRVRGDLTVINMFGQHGIYPENGAIPLRYFELQECLQRVRTYCHENAIESIHAPRFGAGLAGGNWDIIEDMITRDLSDIPVYIYTLPKQLSL
jgi:hypothetical protein